MQKSKIEKLNDKIENFNDLVDNFNYFNEKKSPLQKKEEINFNAIKESINIAGRKLVEDLISLQNNYLDERKTHFITEKHDALSVQNWSIINKAAHSDSEGNTTTREIIFTVNKLYDSLKINIKGDLLEIKNIKDVGFVEIWKDKLEDSPYFNEYNCFVERAYYNRKINTYHLQHYIKFNNGYIQKERIIYSKEILFKDCHYILSGKRQVFLIEKKEIKVYRYILTKYKMIVDKIAEIDEEIIKCKEIIVKNWSISPFLFFQVNMDSDEEIILNLKKILLSYSGNLNPIIRFFIALKFNTNFIINNNIEKIPMEYEFWTKQPRKCSFNISEKESIRDILNNLSIELSNPPFFGYENSKFSNNLKLNESHFKDYYEDWSYKFPDNNDFNGWKNEFKYSKIVKFKYKGKDKLTLYKFYIIFNKIDDLLKNQKIHSVKILSDTSDFTEEKKESFNKIVNRKISIIKSPAGHGKTKLASYLIKEFQLQGENTVFIGPTHKSTKVISEIDETITPNVYTVQKIRASNNSEFLENYDNLIIDEITMINDNDWISLIENFRNKKRIIFIGDDKQLPPIHSIGIYKYIFSNKNKKFIIELKENFRQKENKELKNEIEVFRDKGMFKTDKFLSGYTDIKDFYEKLSNFNEEGYEVFLTPIHQGIFGTKNLNSFFSGSENKFESGDTVIIDAQMYNSTIKRILYMDRILKIQYACNDFIEFENTFYKEENWPNNIEGFNIKNKKLFYYFDNSNIEIPFSKAKSITIHASQGSTFKSVCLIIPKNFNIKSSSLYTAISRSSNNLVVLHFNDDINKIKS